MNRQTAHELTRAELEKHGLTDWGVRLTMDANAPFLGKCVYKDKVIILNAHHIDINPDNKIINTIKHEVAHCLAPGDGHGSLWVEKCKLTGARPLPCSHLFIPENVIDAIRSGQIVDLEIETETHVIERPKFTIRRLQDKCPFCGKVAEEKFFIEGVDNDGNQIKWITLKCFHIIKKIIPKATPFENAVSNDWKLEVKNCKHVWNKTQCTKCKEFKLYPFQVIGARFAEAGLATQKGVGIFDDMGLGKTVQMLMILKFHPEYKTLAVVKSALTFQTFQQALRWNGPAYTAQIIRTSRDVILPNFKLYIISYDLLRRMKPETMQQLNINLVVLDECQQIKNPDATRTGEVRKLVGKPEVKVIALSGTPWNNRGSEFFPVLNMMDPVKFPSYMNFVKQWCDYYEHGNKTKMGGIANVAKFREHTKDMIIRREYNEVMDEFPEINKHKLSIQLDDLNQSTYNDATSDFVTWYNQFVIDGTEDSINSMELLGKLSRMKHITGLAKVPATVSFVEEFIEDTNRKLVIFTHHKDVNEILYTEVKKICAKHSIPVLNFTAELSDEARFELEKRFNELPRCIMLAATRVCGEGKNFQTCSDAVMHERQWDPKTEEQASPGRFRRIGQKATAINTTYIEAQETIDEWIDELIEQKDISFHKSMNKSERKVWTEGSMGQALAQKIVAKHKKDSKGQRASISKFARM